MFDAGMTCSSTVSLFIIIAAILLPYMLDQSWPVLQLSQLTTDMQAAPHTLAAWPTRQHRLHPLALFYASTNIERVTGA